MLSPPSSRRPERRPRVLFAGPAAALLAVFSGCATGGGPGKTGGASPASTVIGPVYERTVTASGDSLLAVRPLFARETRADPERNKTEVLWPLYSSRFQSNQFNWRAGVWFGADYDVDDPESISRFWLLPFWFHGVNREGESYRALFPLGGRIDGILGLDRVSFFLFPLYETHEINGIVTTSYLWPLFSFTRGEDQDIQRSGLFPFYGVSRRGDDWTSRYALWPIWTHRSYSGKEQGSAWMVFPLYGRVNTDREQGWYVLPPFFSVLNYGDESRRHLPWPFVQLQDGRVRKRYLWPLFGVRRTAAEQSTFVLWPFWRTRETDGGDSRIRFRRLIPFWDHSRVTDKKTGETTYAYDQIWPLGSRMRKGDEYGVRVLDLWPGRHREAVDRNWSPWWTLYQRYSSPSKSAWRALFGLVGRSENRERGRSSGRVWPLLSWRRREAPDEGRPARAWNFLGGLVGYRRDHDGDRRLRLGYLFSVPLGSAASASPQDPVGSDEDREVSSE